MIKAFIFDMDGVIVNSEPFQRDIETDFLKSLGIIDSEYFLDRHISVIQTEMLKNAQREFNIEIDIAKMYITLTDIKSDAFVTSGLTETDGLTALLDYLEGKGIMTGIASSSPPELILTVIRVLGIAKRFHTVVSGESVEKGKPEPMVYIEAAKQMGIAPEECVALEDSQNGIKAAKGAGMICIALRNPDSGAQDLSLADHTVNSLHEIPCLLKKLIVSV